MSRLVVGMYPNEMQASDCEEALEARVVIRVSCDERNRQWEMREFPGDNEGVWWREVLYAFLTRILNEFCWFEFFDSIY